MHAQSRGWGGGVRHRPRGRVRPWRWMAPSCPQQNIETWMKDKSEVEVVDLVLKLREKLVRCLLALSSLHQPDVEVTCP